jgi:spermidine synthase
VLQIGLGAASLTKFLYRHRPRAALTVVEIEPAVVAAARAHFKLPEDPKRVTIEIGDGADYLAAGEREFDLILVDGFDAKGRAGMLEMLPFYCNVHARLSERGLLVANMLTRTRGVGPAVERMRAAFHGRARALPPCSSGNTIVVAAAGAPVDVVLSDLRAAAHALKSETGLNLLPSVARLVEAYGGKDQRFVV